MRSNGKRGSFSTVDKSRSISRSIESGQSKSKSRSFDYDTVVDWSPEITDMKSDIFFENVDEILDSINERLSCIIKQSQEFYFRDKMWAKLYTNGDQYDAGITFQEYLEMFDSIYVRNIKEFDSELIQIFQLDLDVVELVTHLTTIYRQQFRQFHFSSQLHLVIYNNSNTDQCIRVAINEQNQTFSMEVCRRYSEDVPQQFIREELDQVSSFVSDLCRWIWKTYLLEF